MNKKIKQHWTTGVSAGICFLIAITSIIALFLGNNSYFSSVTKEEKVIMYDEELLIVDQNWRITKLDDQLIEKEVIKENGTIPCVIT